MIARALFAVLALPGVFAALVPWMLAAVDPWAGDGVPAGMVAIAAGVVALALCVRDFLRVGRGTLGPWDPPRTLVVVGLYRFVRNPMYLAVLLIVSGGALASGSVLVASYLIMLGAAFHLRVVLGEEPELAARFDAQWTEYAQAVPRWFPRWTAWRRGAPS